MQVGDKVIINPNIPDGAWSDRYSFGFHSSTMMKPGVFTLGDSKEKGGFFIDGYYYDEDWLLPVPLFKEGDKVKLREDLSIHDDVPFTVNCDMEELAGSTFTVIGVCHDDRHNSCLGFDGRRYTLNGKAEGWSWSSPMFDLTNYKIKSNESRLQEQESPLRRGSGEIVCGICCRKHKPRVTVKSVGYKKVIGRG